MSTNGASMFCVESYVNTPELCARRCGGLSQGLPANGSYKSLFRAGFGSESRVSASNHHKTNATAPALHFLAEVAQSPKALSPISATASPQPTPTAAPVPAPTSVPTSKKRSRKPLIASTSPPASTIAPLDPISATPSSPVASTNASNGNGEGREQRYERGLLPSGRQLSVRPSAEYHESESAVQDRPRNVQKNKNKNRVASSKEVGPLPQAPPAPADRLSYDHAEGEYFPSYFDPGHSGASDIACEGGRSLSPLQAIVNHYPSKESSLALMADSRSVMPGTKPRMITSLIEDRRRGADELAEVHVLLTKATFCEDAKDVYVVLQNGPSRIDDDEETTQSVNLKVETNRTLPVVVEGISDPHVVMPVPFLSANPRSLVSTGPGAPVMNTVRPLSLPSVSNHLGLDGIHTTTSEVGQWSGGARKRKRETSFSQVQQLPFGSSAARSMPTLHEQYYGRPWESRRNNPISSSDGGGYMSDSPPAAYRPQSVEQRREQTYSGSFLDRSGYERTNPRCP